MAEGAQCTTMLVYQKHISDKVWSSHKETIRDKLNTAIFPYLVPEDLLKRRDSENYDGLYLQPNSVKIYLLVDCIPKCGQNDYLVKFIGCLRQSHSNEGGLQDHKKLADLLEEEYDSLMRRVEEDESYRKSLDLELEIHKSGLPVSTCVQAGYQNGSWPHPVDYPLQTASCPRLKCVCKYKGRLALFLSPMVWLVLGGIITSVLYFEYPPIGPSDPPYIQCRQDYIISVDLGANPDSLTSFSMSIVGGQHNALPFLYAANLSCSHVPTVEQTVSSVSKYPPYYLVNGSSMNVTNSMNESVDFWFVKQWPLDCKVTSSLKCAHPPNASFHCVRISPGGNASYQMSASDYYIFCANGTQLTESKEISYSLKEISYNRTAIKELYSPSIHITSSSKTAQYHELPSGHEYCMLLDINPCNAPYRTSGYQLKVSVVRIHPFLPYACPMVVAVILCLFHFVIVFVCIYRRWPWSAAADCRNRKSKSYVQIERSIGKELEESAK